MGTLDTIAAWRTSGETANIEMAVGCLARDVELVSPLTSQFTFRGRAQVRQLLMAAFEVIDGISYYTEVTDGPTSALFYRGRCMGYELEEAQLIRLDGDGLIHHLTLFTRPLPGTTAVLRALGPRLARLQGKDKIAGLLTVATLPLHALVVSGEHRIVPLAAPGPPADL